MSLPIRIALLDDHPIIHDGVRAMLMSAEDMLLAASAIDEAELKRKCRDFATVDVLLLDIKLGSQEREGLEIAKRVLAAAPNVQILAFSSQEDEEVFREAMQIGVKGFLSKHAAQSEFLQAIRTVNKGQAFFGSHMAQQLVYQYAEQYAKAEDAWAENKLSDRETEILVLFAEGLSYKEIGAQLDISPRTVEGHKKNILDKLHLQTTIDMVKYAIKHGLIEL